MFTLVPNRTVRLGHGVKMREMVRFLTVFLAVLGWMSMAYAVISIVSVVILVAKPEPGDNASSTIFFGLAHVFGSCMIAGLLLAASVAIAMLADLHSMARFHMRNTGQIP